MRLRSVSLQPALLTHPPQQAILRRALPTHAPFHSSILFGNAIANAGLHFQPMTPADIERVTDHTLGIERELGTRIIWLFKPIVHAHLAKLLKHPDTYSLTLWDKANQLVGTTMMVVDDNQNGGLTATYLKKDYRRRGIGTQLIMLRETRARELKLKKLLVQSHHPDVVTLYQRLGFQDVPPPKQSRWGRWLWHLLYKPMDGELVYLEKPLVATELRVQERRPVMA